MDYSTRARPFRREEDLKKWSGNISILDDHRKGGLSSQNRAIARDLKPTTETEAGTKERPKVDLSEKSGKRFYRAKAPIGKFFLSALVSRLFFLALLPICLGVMMKALFDEVSPQGAD